MANVQEIRTHIKSVQETKKITNAMYLISSNNLRKAKKHLNDVAPYFRGIEFTISDILHRSPNMKDVYLDRRPQIPDQQRKIGLIVITADKGLAGAYNHSVLKLAASIIQKTPGCQLFPIGQMGRAWFRERQIAYDSEFDYSAQDPTSHRAREISQFFVDKFRNGDLDEVWCVYTEMVTALKLEPCAVKLLPLQRDTFPWEPRGRLIEMQEVTYVPSQEAVLSALVPGYLQGMLLSMLVESYCSEQQARMSSMDSSTKSATDLLQKLNLEYNRARQAAITQEINEVTGGAQAGRQ